MAQPQCTFVNLSEIKDLGLEELKESAQIFNENVDYTLNVLYIARISRYGYYMLQLPYLQGFAAQLYVRLMSTTGNIDYKEYVVTRVFGWRSMFADRCNDTRVHTKMLQLIPPYIPNLVGAGIIRLSPTPSDEKYTPLYLLRLVYLFLDPELDPSSSYHSIRYDVITSRAFSASAPFVRAVWPLLRPRGRVIALKGHISPAETSALRKLLDSGEIGEGSTLEQIRYSLPGLRHERTLLIVGRAG